VRPSDDDRGEGSDPDLGDDADDSGDELEAAIEQADRPFGSASFGTTAEEQLEGESLDQRLAEERPSRLPVDEAFVIEDADGPDEEAEMLGEASLEHDPFTAPEEAAVRVRESAPGGVDHAPDPKVESCDDSPDQD
jgi:hypothetical protein